MDAAIADQVAAAAAALPATLDALAASVEHGRALLQENFQEARVCREEEPQSAATGASCRCARTLGALSASVTLPFSLTFSLLLSPMQTIRDIVDQYEPPTMSVEDTWRFLPITSERVVRGRGSRLPAGWDHAEELSGAAA